jgi:hypothetical protein
MEHIIDSSHRINRVRSGVHMRPVAAISNKHVALALQHLCLLYCFSVRFTILNLLLSAKYSRSNRTQQVIPSVEAGLMCREAGRTLVAEFP